MPQKILRRNRNLRSNLRLRALESDEPHLIHESAALAAGALLLASGHHHNGLKVLHLTVGNTLWYKLMPPA
jgi:hypothetical protein